MNQLPNLNTKSKISVLVVDDSITIRKQIIRILEKSLDFSIIGEAKDGKEAILLTAKLKPDVIVMDIVMPVMNGLDAVKYIMIHMPVPIVIHSSNLNKGESFRSWDATIAGALAVIDKSEASYNPDKWEQNLIRSIRVASKFKVSAFRKSQDRVQNSAIHLQDNFELYNYNVVAFGISTGGPKLMVKILNQLPSDFQLPLLLVIHLPIAQGNIFPDWLNNYCNIKVTSAINGMSLESQRGSVLVAPVNKHMIVENNRIKIIDSKPVNFCKPSVDVLFHSLAQDHYIRPIAVLMTGMGNDGASGLKEIKDNGGYAICQDKATSVIFGMPKAGIDIGAADIVLPDHQIAGHIMDIIYKKKGMDYANP